MGSRGKVLSENDKKKKLKMVKRKQMEKKDTKKTL